MLFMNKQALSRRIRQLREFRNYTQAYVAAQLGICQNTYSQLESGITYIKDERLAAIARVLNVTLERLTDTKYELLNPNASSGIQEPSIARLEHMVRCLSYEIAILKKQNESVLEEIRHLRQA